MAQEIIEVPDFKFGMYYADILESLLEFHRENCPELTDESEFEPAIQLLRAYAIATHEHNVLLDIAAQESLLETARLVSSVRALLKAQGYNMRSAQPAKVQMCLELTGPLNVSRVVVPDGAQFSTERDSVSGGIAYFEADEAVSSTATEFFTAVGSYEDGIWTDFTTACNTASSPGTDWTPWGTADAGDTLYFCHDSVMWDRLDMFVSTATIPGSGFGVWEFYQGDTVRAKPDSVEQVASRIRFVVNSYLGDENRQGTVVRVRLNSTLETEDATVYWDGSRNIIETGLIGQAVVSTDIEDYSIGSEWEALTGLTTSSGVGDLYPGVDEEQLAWDVPQSTAQNWIKTTLEGVEGYWMRFRWIEAPSSGPTMRYVRMLEGKQYIMCSATQGRTYVDSPLGSSDGSPDQSFEGSKSNFIDDGMDELLVDGVLWERQDDFLSSSATDQHYVVELTGDDPKGLVKFGNGSTGAIPAVGVSNIIWTYRYGANVDGNVGAGTVTKDQTSLVLVNRVWNPRQGNGWSAEEGATEQSLQRAKQLAARLNQSKGVALSASDIPPLAIRYQDDQGASPFVRAYAIEEAYGPKTVGLVVMVAGGGQASASQLEDLEDFFNGTDSMPSRMVANQQLTVVNFETREIDIDAVVYASGVTRQEIENALSIRFQPDATDEDGNWVWEFGDLVSVSKIDQEIHDVSKKIKTVTLSTPAQDIQLDSNELPTIGSLNITVIDPKKGS